MKIKLTGFLLFMAFVPVHMFSQNNLLDTSTWDMGNGSAPGFNKRGTDAENIREMGVGPHSEPVLLWKVVPQSSGGGWNNTDYHTIQSSKTYRFTSWIKKENSKDGSIYLAFFCRDENNVHTGLNLNGTVNSAPYFFSSDPPELDQWYLLVSYVHENGYASTVNLGGIYDTNGNKVGNTKDFKFSASATKVQHRSYLAFSTNTMDRAYFYAPTIYEVNGLEPTIQELIDGPNGNTSDTQSPTSPVLASVAHNENTVNLSWSGATDNTGVTGYKIFKDGTLESTLGNVGTYQVTGLIAGTSYSFTATALDAAGNESAASNVVNVTTSTSDTGGSDSTVWSETGSVASYAGDVAIGTSTVPIGYKMAVDGKLITEEVKVQLSGNWPDYVFAKDYNLPTLEEVQRHINEKGHLPNIPSAIEVEANGIEVGEMNRLLLEKIEELTLYTLEQAEALKNQNKINKHLLRRLEKIERQFNISNNED